MNSTLKKAFLFIILLTLIIFCFYLNISNKNFYLANVQITPNQTAELKNEPTHVRFESNSKSYEIINQFSINTIKTNTNMSSVTQNRRKKLQKYNLQAKIYRLTKGTSTVAPRSYVETNITTQKDVCSYNINGHFYKGELFLNKN